MSKNLEKRQTLHLSKVQKYIKNAVEKKYTAGMLEHQSCLGDMSEEDLLKNIEEEAIDMLVYVAALKIKRGES